MYVDYGAFVKATVSAITADEYARLAPIADAVIDNWTLERVGRAFSNGEALPAPVVALYCAIVEALPAAMADSRGGVRLSAFSNGVDSFTFASDDSTAKRLADSVGWMLDLLPVEWRSAAVCFEGGNAYAG